jgi:AcrR family transcriptional regulator
MSVAVAPQLPARRRGRPPIAGLRDDILRAAEAVFTRHEYHQVQMDQVAEACGVGKGTLYRYFPSKRALYLAVVFEGIARLRVELEAALAAADAPARRIELIVRRTLAYFWDRRFFFALIHRHEPQRDGDAREWLRQREQLALLVAQTVEKAIAVGQVRRVDARIAAEMLLGMIRGANRYRLRGDRLEDLVGFIVGVFMRGVGTPAGLHVLAGDRRRRKP